MTTAGKVYVTVEFDDAEAARAARIRQVEVFTECSGPVEEPDVAVYECEVNGEGRLIYPPEGAVDAWYPGGEHLE